MSIFIIFLLFSLLNCQTETSKEELLREAILRHYQDFAFKENKEFKLYELDLKTYQMKNDNFIDTLKLAGLNKMFDLTIKSRNAQIEVAKSMAKISGLYSGSGLKELSEVKNDEIKKYLDKATELENDINSILLQDSIIRNQIKNRKNIANRYYYANYYLKATIGNENILDTFILLFDENFNRKEYKIDY